MLPDQSPKHGVHDGLNLYGAFNAKETAVGYARHIRLIDPTAPVTTFSVHPKPGYVWVWTLTGQKVRKAGS